MSPDLRCAVCSRALPRPEQRFIIQVRGFASPEMPEFTRQDLQEDLQAQIRAIIEHIRHAGLEELRELEEEVFFSRIFTTCRECYRRFVAHPLPERHELYPEEQDLASPGDESA